MNSSPAKPLMLFDGVCNLCNNSVQFIIERDPQAHLQFASLQSNTGQALLKKFQLPTDDFDTFVLIENDRAFTRSSGALKAVRHLKGLWPLLYGFIIIPKPIRDFFYNLVARNRYRWFGKQEHCMLPTPDLKQRFLD